jgi:hypothetical protein
MKLQILITLERRTIKKESSNLKQTLQQFQVNQTLSHLVIRKEESVFVWSVKVIPKGTLKPRAVLRGSH